MTRNLLPLLGLSSLLWAGCGEPPPPAPVCGDGLIESPETCEDGNASPGDGCDQNCQIEILPECGDLVIDPGEVCDDGNDDDGDGCRGDCLGEEICGDGLVDVDEECDDGNNVNGDNCQSNCLIPGLCDGVTEQPGAEVVLAPVASGLTQPVYLTAPPRDVTRLVVVEQDGLIRLIKNGQLLTRPFLDVSDRTNANGERGLLSVAFHPDFFENGRLFVFYTADDGTGALTISEFGMTSDPDLADENSERILLQIPHEEFGNHNGGLLKFGPDGFLYIGTGDGGGGNDPLLSGQDLGQHLGKLLRIDVDSGNPFGIPSDNPFVSQKGALPEIWHFGLRNPWRYSFDRATGDLYIGDVGQGQFEEVDFAPAGQAGINWGWSDMEGNGHCINNPNCNDPALGITLPITEYAHSATRCSITGGYVYRGCERPDLQGTYFYGDLCAGEIFSLKVAGGASTEEALVLQDNELRFNLVSFGEDARGEVYVVSHGGDIFRLGPP